MTQFSFNTTTGEFKHDALHLGYGYSGNGAGKNNQELEHVQNIGPIPRGVYGIGEPRSDDRLGPLVFRLVPKEGTNTFGRSAFDIHGDSIDHPGDGSDGCVVLARTLRQIIAMSADRNLDVI